MAAQNYLSASEQTAINAWIGRHRVTLATIVGGLVLVIWLGHRNGLSFTPLGLLMWALMLLLLRHVAGLALWMRRRRLQFAKAHLPSPSLARLVADHFRERRTVASLRKQWETACRANGYLGAMKVAPKLYDLKSTIDGDVTAFVSPGKLGMKGEAVSRLVALKPTFAEQCGAVDLRVKRAGVGNARLTFLFSDPLERVVPIQDLPWERGNRIVYGVTASGKPATLDPNKSILCAGVQGSGKSSFMWTVLCHWLRNGDWVDLYVIDPKGGQEWGWLQRLATIDGCRVKVRGFTTTEDAAIKMLNTALERVRKRQAENGELDLDDWDSAPVRQVVPTEDEPRIVILADELLHLRKALKDTATTPSPFGQFISIGRSAAASVIAVSQDATKETVGMVRDLFGQRVCLRTSSPSMTAMVLHETAESMGARCSMIPEDQPGRAFAFDSDNGTYEPVKIAYVTDADIKNDIQWGRAPAGMLTGEKPEVERQCGVYRLFSSDMVCVYVGKGFEPKTRWDAHAGLNGQPAKWWWQHVDMTRTVVTWHENEAAAFAEEEAEIKRLLPFGNEQHNKTNPLRGKAQAVPTGRVKAQGVAPKPHWWQKRQPQYVAAEPVPVEPTLAQPQLPQQSPNVTPIRRRPQGDAKPTRRKIA